jgi:hypothetical protein
MRIVKLAACVSLSFLAAELAFAQGSPPPESPTLSNPAPVAPAQSASTPEAPVTTAPTQSPTKRQLCRTEARNKGLRGKDAAAEVAICVAQARLDCTKQAAAQHLARRELNDFVRKCLGQNERSRSK